MFTKVSILSVLVLVVILYSHSVSSLPVEELENEVLAKTKRNSETAELNNELEEIQERRGCESNYNIPLCQQHKGWGRCEYDMIKNMCPCTCAGSGGGGGGGGGSNSNSNSNSNSGDSNSSQAEDPEVVLLNEHNERRSRHGVPPLVYDEGLARTSKAWCDSLAARNTFAHSDQTNAVERYGENLFFASRRPQSTIPSMAVEKWYEEIDLYDFNNPGFSGATGHFTQVVWKGTKKVGCGVTTPDQNKKKRAYVCCQYTPPGNYIGEFRENVPLPRRS